MRAHAKSHDTNHVHVLTVRSRAVLHVGTCFKNAVTWSLWPGCRVIMLPNTVTITQQQARLLLPLLQQIANSDSPGPSHSSPCGSCSQSGSSCGSSSSSPPFFPTPTRMAATGSGQVGGYSTDESETACRYSSDELFQTKNTKSSSAHSYFHVSTMLCKLFIYKIYA